MTAGTGCHPAAPWGHSVTASETRPHLGLSCELRRPRGGRSDEPSQQRTLEAGRLGTPVGGVRPGYRCRRPRHPGVVDSYWVGDSGRRRGYVPDWRRGRLHRVHPGLPGASKAATLVLAAQAGAYARRYPRSVVRRTPGEGSRRCSSEPAAHLLLRFTLDPLPRPPAVGCTKAPCYGPGNAREKDCPNAMSPIMTGGVRRARPSSRARRSRLVASMTALALV